MTTSLDYQITKWREILSDEFSTDSVSFSTEMSKKSVDRISTDSVIIPTVSVIKSSETQHSSSCRFCQKFVWIHLKICLNSSSQFIRILYKINIQIQTKFQLFLQLFRSFWSWWDHDDVNSEIRWQSLSLIIIISLSRSRSTSVFLSLIINQSFNRSRYINSVQN